MLPALSGLTLTWYALAGHGFLYHVHHARLGAESQGLQASGSLVPNRRRQRLQCPGRHIGKIEGNSYSVPAVLSGQAGGPETLQCLGSLVAKFDGGSIYIPRFPDRQVGQRDLSDAHGAGIGKIEGAGGPYDPATVFLASLLLGII